MRVDQRELSGLTSAAETSRRAPCAKIVKPAIRECPRRPRWGQERPLKAAAGLELSRTVFTAPGQVGSFRASADELLETRQRGGLENARLLLDVGRRHASQGAERDAPATVRYQRRVVGQEIQGGGLLTLLVAPGSCPDARLLPLLTTPRRPDTRRSYALYEVW